MRAASAARSDAATGVTPTRTYDDAGRVATQQAATATLAAFELDYDPAGNVVAKDVELQGASASVQREWVYGCRRPRPHDERHRPGDTTTAYGYDGAGNRTSVKVGDDPAVSTAYDAAGHPTSSSDGTAYTTDATGALIRIRKGTSDTTYRYDALGRMIRAQVGTGGGGYAIGDGAGRLIFD